MNLTLIFYKFFDIIYIQNKEGGKDMSYYYDYYIGYEKDGKIYPLGPYDSFGTLKPALSRSRSFASDLHKMFYRVRPEKKSKQLQEALGYLSSDEEMEIKYLPISELPSESYIKSGYFLIKEVEDYLRTEDSTSFSQSMDSCIYAARQQNELLFSGRNDKIENEDGDTYRCSDFMYFAFPDYFSKEYESFVLRSFLESLLTDKLVDRYVILETEG